MQVSILHGHFTPLEEFNSKYFNMESFPNLENKVRLHGGGNDRILVKKIKLWTFYQC